MKEIDIQSTIIKYLKKNYRGCVVWKIEDEKLSGIPDIYFAYQAHSFWFEVKTPTGRREDIQKYCIKKLNKNFVPAYFVESLDDVKRLLTKWQL